MLTGLTVEDMYVYYTIAMVHAVATFKTIRLFVDIPLKATDRHFELYQVHSLPFYHEGIGKFVTIDEAFTYLAVAENRNCYVAYRRTRKDVEGRLPIWNPNNMKTQYVINKSIYVYILVNKQTKQIF
jgi:hypothetical protein